MSDGCESTRSNAPLKSSHDRLANASEIGVRFVVTDGVTGRLAPRGDPAAFAEQLTRALEDRSGSAAMAAAGRDEVLGRFGADRLVADIRALYGELLA